MSQRVEIYLKSAYAKTLQELGREFHGDNSLGMPQACYVLLEAIASGEYVLKPAPKRRVKKEEPGED